MTNYRYIGVTDESTVCGLCGRTELKSTVVMWALDADGNPETVVHYGSSCAAKVLGRTGNGRKVLQEARGAHYRLTQEAKFAREVLAAYNVDSDATDAQITTAAARYRENHRNASWAPGLTWIQWEQEVRTMIAHRTAIIREAEHVQG